MTQVFQELLIHFDFPKQMPLVLTEDGVEKHHRKATVT